MCPSYHKCKKTCRLVREPEGGYLADSDRRTNCAARTIRHWNGHGVEYRENYNRFRQSRPQEVCNIDLDGGIDWRAARRALRSTSRPSESFQESVKRECTLGCPERNILKLDQVVSHRKSDQFAEVLKPHFVHDVGAMTFDGAY